MLRRQPYAVSNVLFQVDALPFWHNDTPNWTTALIDEIEQWRCAPVDKIDEDNRRNIQHFIDITGLTYTKLWRKQIATELLDIGFELVSSAHVSGLRLLCWTNVGDDGDQWMIGDDRWIDRHCCSCRTVNDNNVKGISTRCVGSLTSCYTSQPDTV